MGSRRSHIAAIAGTIVLTLGLCLLISPVREALGHAAHGDTTALREQLRGTGAGGVLVLYALMIAHAVVIFPAEITNLVCGFTYGIPLALLICGTGWFASAILTFYIGRHLGRPLLTRLAGDERTASIERTIERGGATALLILRLLPIVPFSLLGYVSGAARVPLARFAWTTAVGQMPLIAAAVVLGSRLEHFSLTDPLIWGMLGVFLVLFALSHPVIQRMRRARQNA